MHVEILFPRTTNGQRVEIFDMAAIPHAGDCITTDGDDCWDVDTVIHFAKPAMSEPLDGGIVAQLRVR